MPNDLSRTQLLMKWHIFVSLINLVINNAPSVSCSHPANANPRYHRDLKLFFSEVDYDEKEYCNLIGFV